MTQHEASLIVVALPGDIIAADAQEVLGSMLTSRQLSLWLVGVFAVVSASCGGGGTTPLPPAVPVITSVSPEGTVGSAGGWVRFHAEATNAPTEWEWDFGEGGSSSESTLRTPRTTLNSAGIYTGSVTARNTVGDSTPVAFTYTIQDTAVAPRWSTEFVSDRATGITDPDIVVTETAVVIFGFTPEPGAGTESGYAPLLAVASRAPGGELSEWTVTVPPPDSGFPTQDTRWNGDLLQEADGRVWLCASDKAEQVLAYTEKAVPAHPADWTIMRLANEGLTPGISQDPDLSKLYGHLAFIGQFPCLILMYERDQSGANPYAYALFSAIAQSAAPLQASDWDALDVLRYWQGTPFTLNENPFNVGLVSCRTNTGGLTFVFNDEYGMRVNHMPDPVAFREDRWLQSSGFNQDGKPLRLEPDGDGLLFWYQANVGNNICAPRVALARCADGTGVNFGSWEEALSEDFFLGHGGSSCFSFREQGLLWEGRPVAVNQAGQGPLSLARAVGNVAPRYAPWQVTAGPFRFEDMSTIGWGDVVALAAEGQDLFVAIEANPDSSGSADGLDLAVAEGSW